MDREGELVDILRHGDLERLRTLLTEHPEIVNAPLERDPRRARPLHLAAALNRPGAAALLLDAGADHTLCCGENDATPLGWAAFFGRPRIAEMLIASGADINQRNRHGMTPLGCSLAGTEGRWDSLSDATREEWRATAELLKSHGALE